MTATETEAPPVADTRFHAGLHVADLDRSVRFYRALFGVGPAKHFDDYARFELASPPIVLALYPSPQAAGGALNHVGLRFPGPAGLVEVQRRLEEAGVATQRQEGVECCYSRQTKFWVTDPDTTMWEVYTLEDDLDHSGFDDAPAPAEVPAQNLWQHRIDDPLPERIPHADGTLDAVLLEGTFNAALAPGRVEALVAGALRALKPGGKLSVHALVGDAPFPGAPDLPGLASVVERVPVETEPLAALTTAGFAGVFYEKLGDIHCFRVNGVELRELRLRGTKPTVAAGPGAVVYRGPFAEVVGECGTAFRRGERVEVSAAVVGTLRAGPVAEQFAFLS